MKTVLLPLIDTLIDVLRSRASLHLEMLAMRQQLAMIADRDCKRIRFRSSERLFWVWLYSLWPTCLQTLMIFKPDTLVRWHRKGFRLYWTWRTFLDNHVADLVSVDFFTVPTATFRILYAFVILHHKRREIVHFNATYHPTAQWTA